MDLQDLPNEVIVDIFRLLAANDNAAISLTCKSFHEVVEPILYSSFDVSRDFKFLQFFMDLAGYFLLLRCSYDQEQRNLSFLTNLQQTGQMSYVLLICTLLDKPHLAQHLKTLSLEDRGESPRSDHQIWLTLSRLYENYNKKIISIITPYITTVGIDSFIETLTNDRLRPVESVRVMVDEWIVFRRRRNYFDYVFCILLLLSPNLQEIDLRTYNSGSKFLFCFLSNASRLQRKPDENVIKYSLPNLRKISFKSTQYVGSYLSDLIPLSKLSPIIDMPSLQSFSCSKVAKGAPIELASQGNTLRELSLFGCQLLPYELTPIITSLSSLRSLKIQRCDSGYTGIPQQSLWPRLIESIDHLHDSLEILSFRDESAAKDGFLNRLPSLHHFHKLRILEIEADFLEDNTVPIRELEECLPENRKIVFYDFAAFPSTLEELTIYNSCVVSAMDHLQYSICNLPFNKLKVILVNYEKLGLDLEQARRLSRRYRDHGVTLMFRVHEERCDEDNNYSYYTWTVCASSSGLESNEIVCVRDVD